MSIKNLEQEFKEIKTYEDFKNFYNKITKEGYVLLGKRREFQAVDFIQLNNSKIVSYIYDDGKSVGKSRINQLYRYLKIGE